MATYLWRGLAQMFGGVGHLFTLIDVQSKYDNRRMVTCFVLAKGLHGQHMHSLLMVASHQVQTVFRVNSQTMGLNRASSKIVSSSRASSQIMGSSRASSNIVRLSQHGHGACAPRSLWKRAQLQIFSKRNYLTTDGGEKNEVFF